MKKTLPAFVLVASLTASLHAQQKIDRFWGSKGYDVCYSAAATTDGGYILTGLSQSGADTIGDIIVIKTNASGATQWTLHEGGPKLEGGNYVLQTADGGYMVSGHTEDYGADDCDAFLMKIDKNGTKQWLHVYGGEFDDIGEGAIEMADGSFVVAGITASYGNGGIDGPRHAYFIKTNSKGEKVWEKYYAGAGSEYAYDIAAMDAGGFLAVGWTTSFGKGEHDAWLLRLTDAGDTLWTRRLVAEGDSRYYKIIPTTDKGYILCGYTTDTKTSKPKGLAVKLDHDGKQLWQVTFGDGVDSMLLTGVAQLPNGNYIFTGITFKGFPGGTAYILTTDGFGNKLYDEVCGGDYSVSGTIAIQGNNGYIVAGSSVNNGDLLSDFWYRTVSTVATGVPTQTMQWPHLYPNPLKNGASVILLPEEDAYQMVTIDVTTTDGRRIYHKDKLLAKDLVVERSMFPVGAYAYQVRCANGHTFKGRFVVE